jgi:hypothetical protein
MSAEMRILVVDDQPNIVDMLATVLRFRGFVVNTAGTAAHAFERFWRADTARSAAAGAGLAVAPVVLVVAFGGLLAAALPLVTASRWVWRAAGGAGRGWRPSWGLG